MSDDERTIVCCGRLASFEQNSPARRAALEKIDGPYEIVVCSYCGERCVCGRAGQQALKSGQTDTVMCTECLVASARALDERLPK